MPEASARPTARSPRIGETPSSAAQRLAEDHHRLGGGEHRRVTISMHPALAGILSVRIEDLIGAPAKRGSNKREPAPKLRQQLERIEALTTATAEQRAIAHVIDSVLAAHQ